MRMIRETKPSVLIVDVVSIWRVPSGGSWPYAVSLERVNRECSDCVDRGGADAVGQYGFQRPSGLVPKPTCVGRLMTSDTPPDVENKLLSWLILLLLISGMLAAGMWLLRL